jgi:putative FmdB family regulatory protein
VPIYEYRCQNEGHQFEVTQKLTEKPLKACQVCQGPVEKLVSATAFHLKGEGWYVTDYKSSGSPANKSSTSEAKEPAAQSSSEKPSSDSGQT